MAKKKQESKGASKRKKLPEKYNKLLKVGVYDDTHRKQLQQRAKRVQQLYRQAVDKIARAAAPSLFDADPAKEFHFSDFPALNKSVDEFIDDMGKQLQANIEDGDSDAWTLANAKNDMVVNTLASVYSIPKDTLKAWRHPHLDALQQFEERRKNGINLSNGGSAADPNNVRKGVWNLDQFKNELELALEQGIGKGKSAADLSRDVRQYLKYPDKLFRRVRDKDGVLRLSKAAASFHPGRGVYRSSYRNALRLTATENNIAYRTCDHLRWNSLPFVIGQEIKISNNHTLHGKPFTDICDDLAGRYPKEFKFTGWHPFCRCYAVSILASEKEMDDYCRRIESGDGVNGYQFAGKVEDFPDKLKEWVKDNDSRIASAFGRQKLPYFLADNPENLPKSIEKRIPHLSDMLRVKGNGDYKNVGFNIYTGAVRATHEGHNFDKKKGWYETAVQDAGFKEGHSVILEKEPQNVYGKRSTEGLWDGMRFEIAAAETNTHNNIRNALKHCASKRDTEVAVVFFPNGVSIEDLRLGISKYNGLRNSGNGQWKQFKEMVFISRGGIISQ